MIRQKSGCQLNPEFRNPNSGFRINPEFGIRDSELIPNSGQIQYQIAVKTYFFDLQLSVGTKSLQILMKIFFPFWSSIEFGDNIRA